MSLAVEFVLCFHVLKSLSGLILINYLGYLNYSASFFSYFRAYFGTTFARTVFIILKFAIDFESFLL